MEFSLGFSLCFVLCTVTTADTRPQSVERELITSLTDWLGYDANARPVASAAQTVNVTIDLALHQIIDLDEPTQVLTTEVFLRLFWNDVSLTWDPEENGDVMNVRIYAKRIWRPDITLYNDVSTQRKALETLYPASVTYDGNVSWLTPVIFRSSCQLDMTYFPWDTQQCTLELGSWAYDGSKLKVNNLRSTADVSVFLENGEYTLDGAPAHLVSEMYKIEGIEKPYERIVYALQLTRKPMFYIFNLILPCMFVSFVGLFAFCLPPNSGEKVSLTVTVLLASTVFLMIVAESVPPQSATVPVVSQYFEAVILLLALTSIVTVLVINVHHRGDYYPPPPRLVSVVVLDWLAALVCMRSHVTLRRRAYDHQVLTSMTSNQENGSHKRDHFFNSQPMHMNTFDAYVPQSPRDDSFTDNHLLFNIWQELKHDKLERKEVEIHEAVAVSHSEWELVAMVLDRVFLACFLAASTLTTLTIILR